jgi:hypothetical protein
LVGNTGGTNYQFREQGAWQFHPLNSIRFPRPSRLEVAFARGKKKRIEMHCSGAKTAKAGDIIGDKAAKAEAKAEAKRKLKERMAGSKKKIGVEG